MKNKILISLLAVGIAIVAYAASEDVITVTSVNGDKAEYKTSKIKEVKFFDDQMVIVDNHGIKEYNVNEVTNVKKKFVPIAVDLGLSVKWASMNIGAECPGDYGDYFAWGNTEPYPNYKDARGTAGSATELKYNGVIDSNGNLTPRYDAATANWGKKWRMPTASEIKELRDRCHWTWTTQNGHNGYKVWGPNGNSIFLPAAGWWSSPNELLDADSRGLYWSATMSFTYFPNAYCGSFTSYMLPHDYYYFSTSCSFPVRPVTTE